MLFSSGMRAVISLSFTAHCWKKTARTYDMIEPCKSLDEQIIASFREMGKSRMRHGLATTGVSDRIVHHATEILEQLQGGNC